jgi:glycosyltransferase involved in cell wall biosynthesis
MKIGPMREENPMKILWLTNIPLPEASILMHETPTPFGGWLVGSSLRLAEKENIDISIAFPHKSAKVFQKHEGEKITYYAFKPIKNARNGKSQTIFESLLQEVHPDLVHIHGTEFPHTLAMMNACEKLSVKAVISIQGLVSVIAKHTTANLPWNVVYGHTLRNLLRKDSVAGLKKQFEKRGRNEIEALKKVKHVIGRTEWDRACTMQINPEAEYHFCSETLRDEFYKHQWNSEAIERYSIFLSQARSPIKGLHYAVEAMAEIVKSFPSAKMYVSGRNPTYSSSLKDNLIATFYANYLKKMIDRLGLTKNIVFTDPLNEKEMCQQYLKSHVFVCPSTIENSPNSLGEAMILGVPCVASYVGGVPDMLQHGEEGFLYQVDAPYMLAHYVKKFFQDEQLTSRISLKAREKALQRHDKDDNLLHLLEIYNHVIFLHLASV